MNVLHESVQRSRICENMRLLSNLHFEICADCDFDLRVFQEESEVCVKNKTARIDECAEVDFDFFFDIDFDRLWFRREDYINRECQRNWIKNSTDAKAREIATFDSIWKWDLIEDEAKIWCDQARMSRCSESSQEDAVLFVRDIFRIENRRSNADCAAQSLWNRSLEGPADKMIDLNSSFWFWCSSCTRDEAYDDERTVAKVFECKWFKKNWKRRRNWWLNKNEVEFFENTIDFSKKSKRENRERREEVEKRNFDSRIFR